MSAISLYAKPSADFAQKLAHSLALIKLAAAEYSPLTQASSLGAEDMVITHLMGQAGLNNASASIFVLDTGMLHAETVALIGRIEAGYPFQVDVYRPATLDPGEKEVERGQLVIASNHSLRLGSSVRRIRVRDRIHALNLQPLVDFIRN